MVEVLVTNLQNKAEHGVVFQCPSDTPPPRDSQSTRPPSLRSRPYVTKKCCVTWNIRVYVNLI